MSCLYPINIVNPSRHYKDDMPVLMRVPCNHCPECMRTKQDEWFFRGVIEFLHYKKLGGATYFVTLTYNDENLPYLSIVCRSSGEVLQVVRCFSARHIRNFIKYFRMLLKKNGYEWKGMKYIVCSEFGEKKGRPHYHLLLHLPFKIPINTLIRLLRQAWQHGYISRSSQGFEVTSHKGIRYVMKYIAKDMDFYKQSAWFGSDDVDTESEEFKDAQPRHWQSMHYGESFIDDVILKSRNPVEFLINNTYTLPVGDGLRSLYAIPRYYHYKMEYRVNKEFSKELDNVVIERTDIGKQVSTLRFARNILFDIAYLKTLRRDVLEQTFPTDDVLKDCGIDLTSFVTGSDDYQYENLHDFKSYREFLIDTILSGLKTFDFYVISLYRNFIRNYPVHDGINPWDYFLDVGSLVARYILAPSYPPEVLDSNLVFMLDGDLEQKAKPLRDMQRNEVNRIKLCRHDYRFRRLESFCYALDFFESFAKINKGTCTKIKDSRKKAVKYAYGDKYVSFSSLTNSKL